MERETPEEEADERREAAIASSASLWPNFKPKSGLTESQLAKFQELHKRRLQIKSRSKIHKRDKGAENEKNKPYKKAVDPPDCCTEPIKPASAPTSAQIPESKLRNLSEGNVAGNKRQKLYWGLDAKERWERKSNM